MIKSIITVFAILFVNTSYSQIKFSYKFDEGAKNLIHTGFVLNNLDTIGVINDELELKIPFDSFKELSNIAIHIPYGLTA